MAGLMNTSAQAGGLSGSVLHGYIVERFSSYDAPFIPMAAILLVGALLWLKIDASERLSAELSAGPMPALV
jgi:MFS transporter, ACS family, glucarate transporter